MSTPTPLASTPLSMRRSGRHVQSIIERHGPMGIRKRPFARVVREICQRRHPRPPKRALRWKQSALDVLQCAAEQYLTGVFSLADLMRSMSTGASYVTAMQRCRHSRCHQAALLTVRRAHMRQAVRLSTLITGGDN